MKINIVYIRHAPKLFRNDKQIGSYSAHDSPIKYDEIENIIGKSNLLVEKFGTPNMCFCSPYKRTRETAEYLSTNIDNLEITIDSDICEFLGYVKINYIDKTPRVDTTTSAYDISPIGETYDNLIKRLTNHINKLGLKSLKLNKLLVENHKSDTLTIWVVTHGYIISNLYKLLTGVKINRPCELGGFAITGVVGKINKIELFT